MKTIILSIWTIYLLAWLCGATNDLQSALTGPRATPHPFHGWRSFKGGPLQSPRSRTGDFMERKYNPFPVQPGRTMLDRNRD